jgi:hypothetical protein
MSEGIKMSFYENQMDASSCQIGNGVKFLSLAKDKNLHPLNQKTALGADLNRCMCCG